MRRLVALKKEYTHIKLRNMGVFILAAQPGRVEKIFLGQQKPHFTVMRIVKGVATLFL
jgi:hypothetical protein